MIAAVVVVVVVSASFGGGKPLPLEPAAAAGSLAPAPPAGPIGPEGVSIPAAQALAPAGGLVAGETVDGISCEPLERLAYHIHVHLTVFVNGAARRIPYGIGIAAPRTGTRTPSGFFVTSGSCFSWLHTHASDGIIHIESPSPRTYTLGDFFDVWHQPLGANRVGPFRGHVVAFYNGRDYAGNVRQIPLRKHAQVQLVVGKPLIAPETITFPAGL
ncbi:MAG TPA: hypothetical protein VH108_10460 [Gaiellaceae bacterium]|nr:hypothetical protein [Gaiellaceae bacterium]